MRAEVRIYGDDGNLLDQTVAVVSPFPGGVEVDWPTTPHVEGEVVLLGYRLIFKVTTKESLPDWRLELPALVEQISQELRSTDRGESQ